MTAIRDKEHLRTPPKMAKQVYFGQNALHDSEGFLRTGDAIIIHEVGPDQPHLEA